MKEHENLIPDLINWRKLNDDSFSVQDWIISEGNINFAIGYSFLYWPEFIEYDDCILIASRFKETNFQNWKKAEYVKNFAQIESVLNHIHILDLFGTDEKQNEITYPQIHFLGNKLVEIYSAKLKLQFPERKFIFNFNGDEILEAFDEYELTFYQEKNLNRVI